jgi:hypothetical protein
MIIWINALLKDSTYKAIKKTASDLKVIDDYDSEEAWKYAISSRKYLFEKILNKYDPPEMTKPLSVRQRGEGGDTDGPVQRVERWVNSELERIQLALLDHLFKNKITDIRNIQRLTIMDATCYLSQDVTMCVDFLTE